MTRLRKLSLCIITRNEEGNLSRCMDSVPFADDRVVLDCGSTDGTVELARSLGARVFVEEFRGHVKQKERAVELAEHRWVLSLDADEELSPELAREIQQILDADDDGVAGYELPRKTEYLGRFIEHSGWWPEYRLRLFDRDRGRWTGRDPHDRVEVSGGQVKRLHGPLYHYNYRDLRHHLEKVNRYSSSLAEEMDRLNKRGVMTKLVLDPPWKFFRMFHRTKSL